MDKHNHILAKGQSIEGLYTVTFFLKRGSYAETYRVKDIEGKTKFLKLFIYSQLDRTQFTENDEVLEIQILKQIDHPNLVKYCGSGELLLNGRKYAYTVLDYISGETLADRLKRDETLNLYETKDIISGVLSGINYLHNHKDPILHNDLTNLNVMLDLSGKNPVPKIIDFGFARYLKQSNKEFLKDGLNPFYQPNEAFNKIFSVQSDVFSIGALYYHLLEGLPPWFVEISNYKSSTVNLEDTIIQERTKPLKFNEITDSFTQSIVSKALQLKAEDRFQSADEFVEVLNRELEIQHVVTRNSKPNETPVRAKNGNGFMDIAGMQDLKDLIKVDVIDALHEKEKYAEYGLTIPNGMLLYGPPGCGKTFFSQKMAEEIGFNFYQLKPSDLQSKYVNESQEKIKHLFEEARKNAPSIIFIDELDAVVPNRDSDNVNHMNTSAVNEFLAQMNNCGDDGIFMIGATNRPNSIDPAVLRAGRLDKLIYLPPPDLEARKKLFKLYLENRPVEIGLNYADLAKATENFVSSDIKFLCDEASRMALKSNTRITNEILKDTIGKNRPSINLEDLRGYDAIRAKMEGASNNQSDRPRIGFKNN